MVVADLIKEFRNGYDLAASGLPGFEDDEIQLFLQSAQLKIVNQKFGGNNLYGQKFPDSEKRIDDLQYLMVSNTATSIARTNTKGLYLVTIPDDYFHMVSLTLVTDVSGSNYYNEAVQIDYSKLPRFQRSLNNSGAYIKNPVFIFAEKGYIRLYIDTNYESENLGNLTVDVLYIKLPVDLSIATTESLIDFNIDVYGEIVRLAIDDAIFSVTPNKSQVSQQQLNKTE